MFGEPFADSSALPTHYLARETRRHVKVALSGDGGDELFAGYRHYANLEHVWSRVARVPRPARALFGATVGRSADVLHGLVDPLWPLRAR